MPAKRRSPLPRNRFLGYITTAAAIVLAAAFIYPVFFRAFELSLVSGCVSELDTVTYAAIAAPVTLVSAFVLGTGFWIGWTILTIKVVPPMPDIVEKKDFSKLKALILCIFTLAIGTLLAYGLFIKSYWAIAIPAAAIALVILGAVFWVGIAIITARSTLPADKQQ